MADVLTAVRLLAVPLENDNKHTLFFNSLEEQTDYFLSKEIGRNLDDCTYIRKDKVIRYPADYDALRRCNYVMYRNDAYFNHGRAGKWYYAFITKMEYVNEGRTDIYIETDPIQTWLFDYEVKSSFIEREHVDSDNVGEHTVPEQLETGDYICGTYNKAGYAKWNELSIIVGVTQDENGNQVKGDVYNNIYSGVQYYSFENNTTGITELNNFLAKYPSDGASQAITCMFLAPKKLSREGNGTIVHTNQVDTEYINVDGADSINTDIAFTDNMFDGYIPRNKKLLCYPYRYLYASNNNGGGAVYKYELFYSKQDNVLTMLPPEFEIQGAISTGCSVRLIPRKYNGVEKNHSESLTLGKFPSLNWTSDVYTNWLTQNAVNIPVSIGTAVVQTGLGIAGVVTGGATGGVGAVLGAQAVAGGVTSIASTLGEIYAHSLQPPQAEGNLNSGDVVTASGENDFHFYDMEIKKEMAKIIDGYFDMFGYKVNRVGVPSKVHRENYWYTKTIDVNIDGGIIPMEDIQKIKNCYDSGITFWSNPENIGDYSVSNNIIG